MKAKLYIVTQGRASEYVVAQGVSDALESVDIRTMGKRDAIFLDHVFLTGSQQNHHVTRNGVPMWQVILSDKVYSKLPE